MTSRMCEYGNCNTRETVVTVNVVQRGERPSFCSTEHAGLWLLLHGMVFGKPREALREKLLALLAERASVKEPPVR